MYFASVVVLRDCDWFDIVAGGGQISAVEVDLTPGIYGIVGGVKDIYDYPWKGWRRGQSIEVIIVAYQTALEIIPNKINPYSRGVIPVAILGSEHMDVSDIDVATLRFGPGEAACKHDLTDEWTYNEHLDDVNLDGHMDLMMHYRVEGAGIACGDESATLTGSLLNGEPFAGTDTFETVGCNSNRPRRGTTSRDTERMQRQQPRPHSEEQQHPGDLVEEQRVD
jgi:hypothetical protein